MASQARDERKPSADVHDDLAQSPSNKNRWQFMVAFSLWGLWLALLAWMALTD